MKKRLVSLLLTLALLLSIVPVAAAASYNPGTYSAKAQGFGGLVTAKITVSNSKITKVVLSGAQETPDVGGKALKSLESAVLKKGAKIDTVAGATMTSKAVQRAVKAALAKAGSAATEEKHVVRDGRFTVDVIGHEGIVTVSTLFIDGKIHSVTVPSNNETVGVGTYAVERIPGRIVATQSINVDGITGATVSVNAIKQGVAEAIERAGGSVEDFSKDATTRPGEPKTVEENVQVAIMGAGTAGLFTAARLLEQGVKDIILFEKSDIPGGCMPLTYGGIAHVGSDFIKNWGMGREKNTINGDWEFVRDYYAKYYPDVAAADPELTWVKQMYLEAADMVDWMTSIGIGMMTLGTTPVYNHAYFAPGCYSGGSGYAMQFLVDRITYQGARIIYATPVTDLIQDESGRITGLIAEGKDGTTWKVNADAVMLASGSFAKDKELVAKYFPQMAGFELNSPINNTGDGFKLGVKYGADIVNMGGYVPGFLASYDSHFELAFMHHSTPGMIVNINGDECVNHVKNNHDNMAAAKANPANGDTFYYIFDNAAAAQTKNFSTYLFDTYSGIFEKGEAVHFDTVEEASRTLNLPNLAKSIKKNNELALKGEANEWGRTNLSYIAADTEGIWAIRVDPNYYLPTGGLKIDYDTHVISTDGKTIPGLYAAGDVAGSIEAKQGLKYSDGFTAALSYASVAAKTISADLSK